MKTTNGHILSLLGGGLCLLVLTAFALYPEANPADERAFVPADQVTAAIETATAEKDGPIGGVSVEAEDDGTTLVEVIVRDASGTPFTVEVNATTGEVEEVEEGIEEHHEFGEEEEEYEEEGEEYEEGEEHDEEGEHGGAY